MIPTATAEEFGCCSPLEIEKRNPPWEWELLNVSESGFIDGEEGNQTSLPLFNWFSVIWIGCCVAVAWIQVQLITTRTTAASISQFKLNIHK